MNKPEFLNIFAKGNYSKGQFFKDFRAGLSVAIISLPLSIALGISSGVTPSDGIITAIVAGLVTAILGGTKVQIGGPTGAFVVVVVGIVQKYGLEGLIISTIMGGFILILLGILKLGTLVKFIPYPITVGFGAGVAAILATTQVVDFFGLKIPTNASGFIDKWISYISHMGSTQITTLLVGIGSILVIVYWDKFNKTIPGSLVALIVATVVVLIFNLKVATIGSAFGNIPSTFPMPKVPTVSFDMIKELIGPAITIALLSAISSLLSAVVIDETLNTKHDSNTELIAQGFANIASALFGGIPSAGVLARTSANIRSGGRTPVAGVINGLLLLVVMLLLMPLTKFIPLTTLAAILIVVAYKMTKWKVIYAISKGPKSDFLLLIITFVLTVIFNVVVAVEIGMAIAALTFMMKMSKTLDIKDIERRGLQFKKGDSDGNDIKDINDKILIKELNGALFFGTASTFKEAMRKIEYEGIEVLIFKMKNINELDITALSMLESIRVACKLYNVKFILTDLNKDNINIISKVNSKDFVIFETLEDALDDVNKMFI